MTLYNCMNYFRATHLHGLWIVFAALGCATVGWALQAEEGADIRLLPREAPPRALTPPARRPTPSQRQAARAAPGLGVQWDERAGVPLAVSGEALATARLGGKDLRIGGRGRPDDDALDVLDRLAPLYRIRAADEEFQTLRVDTDADGRRHVRLSQVYRGLPVVGGELLVHFDPAGRPDQINGRYVPDVAPDIRPTLTPEQALDRARRDLWRQGWPSGAVEERPTLVVYARGDEPILAWQLTLRHAPASDGRAGRWRYWIDARSGRVVLGFNHLCTVGAPSSNGIPATISGNLLSGEGGGVTNVAGWYQAASNLYYLNNWSNRWVVFNYSSATIYTDRYTYAWRTNADWGATDRGEISAAHALDWSQRYFRHVLGRASYDTRDAMARANVHVGTRYVNAYWDGSALNFGDGDNIQASSLAVLDVAAHEFTHAVTENSANLTYQDESGALNESFSDIFGAVIEFYAQPDGRGVYPAATDGAGDWLIGEDCWLASTALRDMRDPGSRVTLESGSQMPGRYKGTNWYFGTDDYGGVHINSGVQNFFFYLLSEGGRGTNDGLVYNLTGIGVTNAGRLAYAVLTSYCTADTDYRAAREAWLLAAQALDTNWVAPVRAAWEAVGVTSNLIANRAAFHNDFDNDDETDLTLYHEATGYWYIQLTDGGYQIAFMAFGGPGYTPVAADLDGDGRSDLTVYHEASGAWYYLTLADQALGWLAFGGPGYAPVAADYDGDGRTDLAVYQETSGAWWYRTSADGAIGGATFGGFGYEPAPGDYDGDGQADPTVYRAATGEWYSRGSASGAIRALFVGAGYALPLGDFDGDGAADVAVYDAPSGAWGILYSSSSTVGSRTFGGPSYLPVPGDYDGDGISDLAVYDESTGNWFARQSSDSTILSQTFGALGYRPVK